MREYIVVLADEYGPAFYLQEGGVWGPDRLTAMRRGPATAEAIAEEQRRFFKGRFHASVRIIVEELI
jgi:hypothetical protein